MCLTCDQILNSHGVSVKSLGDGSFVGEIALVTRRRRTASVRAATACSLWALSEACEFFRHKSLTDTLFDGLQEVLRRCFEMDEVFCQSITVIAESRLADSIDSTMTIAVKTCHSQRTLRV